MTLKAKQIAEKIRKEGQEQYVAGLIAVAAPVAFRRVYIDLSGTVDEALEVAARAASMPKKRYLEKLINEDAARTVEEAAGQKVKGQK